MKIAFINNFYNPGGSTKTAFALAENFSRFNEMQFYGFWDGPFRKRFAEIGEAFLMPAENFDYGDMIIKSLEEFDPDIIHVFIPGAQNPSYFYRLPSRAKKFATILCEQKIAFDHTVFDRIFFQSKYGEAFSGALSNGIVVRPGWECDFLEKEQRPRPVLSRVSAFCPSKLIDHTVLAAKHFNRNEWVVAGEIQDRKYYSDLIAFKQENSVRNLKIISNISDSLVEQIINDCDIWHYPTSSEVFCFSVLEAMAAKKPVISYKLDAVKEFFKTDEWLADGFDDMMAKTERMIGLSSIERQKIGVENYRSYLEHLPEIFAEKVMSEYEQFIESNTIDGEL